MNHAVEGPAWEDSITIEDQTQLYSIDMTGYFSNNFMDKKSDLTIFVWNYKKN